MRYIVLIGDIVGSRALPGRGQFQRRLKQALQAVNGRRKNLASPYTLTLGDEFQAVYREAGTVFTDIFSILAEIAPVQARFAVAAGEIVTPINPVQAIGMDGPAFHRARALLEKLKDDEHLLGAEGRDVAAWTLPAATLAILSGQLEGWRVNRLKLFARLLAGEPVAELAKRTGITPRAVNKNIRAADLDVWKGILEELTRLLADELKTR